MSRYTLWVSIESITLGHNGDVPNQNAPAAGPLRNAVVASLTYPRSGAPTVSSGQQYNLPQNNQKFEPDQSDFFVSGLFKEVVEEETILQIKITDTDRASKAEKIFLTILGTLVSASLTEATSGLSAFFGAVAALGVGQIQTGMAKLGQDQVYVIGTSEQVHLRMDQLSHDRQNPSRMAFGLVIPVDVSKGYEVIDGNTKQPKTAYVQLKGGAPNGEIALRLAAVPLA